METRTPSGFFSAESGTYTVTDMFPPRPWYDFLWNSSFIAQIDQFGGGKSWFYSADGVRANHNITGTPADRVPDAWETTERRFTGVCGLLRDPDAVRAGQLASRGTNFEWQMCFAFQFNLALAPGESAEIRLVNGLAETPAAVASFAPDVARRRLPEKSRRADREPAEARAG
jgi:cellobiose phosphorylase